VQNNIGGAGGTSEIVAFMEARRLHEAGQLSDEEWAEVMNRRSWVQSRPAALPAPAPVIDVQAEPVTADVEPEEIEE
jgi:hypothetical protein